VTDGIKRQTFTLGGLLVAAVAALLFLNDRAVVRAADQYCSDDRTSGKLVCQDMPSNKCSDYEGWGCRETKDDGCKCSRVIEQ
jgi:hypothetical protein